MSRVEFRGVTFAQLLYGAGLRLMDCLRMRVKDVKTTQIYTHVLNRPGISVKSPLDRNRAA